MEELDANVFIQDIICVIISKLSFVISLIIGQIWITVRDTVTKLIFVTIPRI